MLIKKSALIAAACVAAALSIPAKADETVPQQSKGFYATLGLGAGWPLDTDVSDKDVNSLLNALGGPNLNGSISADGGFSGEVGAGYDFGDVRAELTYAYNNSSINNLSATYLGTKYNLPASANVNSSSVYLSGYYDIPIKKSRFVPYVGAGIGYTNLSVGDLSATVLGVPITLEGGSESLFGYQAKVGVTYLASKTTDVFLEGVYQGATGFDVGATSYGAINIFGARLGARYRF